MRRKEKQVGEVLVGELVCGERDFGEVEDVDRERPESTPKA